MIFYLNTESGKSINIGVFDDFAALKNIIIENNIMVENGKFHISKQNVYDMISMLKPIYNALKAIDDDDISKYESQRYLSNSAMRIFNENDRQNRFCPVASYTPLVTHKTIKLYNFLIFVSEILELNNGVSITVDTRR